MVFRKYKPASQWGKQDTRIFKAILNARNERKMPNFDIPEAVKNLGVIVHDPTKKEFFDKSFLIDVANEHRAKQIMHPLYKDTPCRLFEAQEPMSDGVDQALVLSNSVLRTEFPVHVMEKALEHFDENKVRDSILHGERYDATLDKLPRRFDPVLFWVTHPRLHGTPVVKRGNIILDNLLRHIVLASIGNKQLSSSQIKQSRDEPFSVAVNKLPFSAQNPLVIRGQPHITLSHESTTLPHPWATPEEVESTSHEPVPSISPLSPLIDLSSNNIYNDEVVCARSYEQNVSIHSLLWTREQNQKYPWTTEQNAACAVLYAYGAAMAESQRRRNYGISSNSPIVCRAVQLVDGRLDLVAIQLNYNGTTEETKKNIVWLQKGLRLYKPRPFYEQLETVEELNMDTFKKLSALILS